MRVVFRLSGREGVWGSGSGFSRGYRYPWGDILGLYRGHMGINEKENRNYYNRLYRV